jgi:hypothetical protein
MIKILENIRQFLEDSINFVDIHFLQVIRFWSQNIIRGFSDKELWDLDETFAKFMLPRLKRFKELTDKYPAEFVKNSDYITNKQDEYYKKKWQNVLNEINEMFEMLADSEKYVNWNNTPEDMANDLKIFYKKVERGLKLFAKYYTSFWM